uniref:Reverse transcriptase domain-containing protein n=1 Tax=Tanacetum cinerariifolium TaxID=118510 RepID=A0A6L2N552_TANCI|nr:hypothetical protein [Tanacetum cinerariifolium]
MKYSEYKRGKGNRQNQVVSNNEVQGRGNQKNQARGRAFMLGVEEARQDPNIVTGTFTLNNHLATTLFDSEIDKVIKGCKLEIKGHVFDIDLIPFGHGSFDVIKGMDWLSNHKAEIICHEKVVRVPLLDGKVLRVLGERPEEKVRPLMSAKASDKKQKENVVVRDFPKMVRIPLLDGKVLRVLGEKPEEKIRQLMSVKAKEKEQEKIVVVRDFPKVFPNDLSGLPPVQEIKFWIELIHRATPVAKSPYHLAPSKLEELSR